jgi:hypothetical protein
MKSALTALALSLTTIVVTPNLYASTLYEMDPSAFTTGISGNNQSTDQSVGTNNDFKAINRVSNWEHSDDPCKVKVKMRHLNNYKETSSAAELRAGCDNDKLTAGYTNSETYVGAIQICHSGSGKLKGLRVWGRKLNRNTGGLSNVARVEDKRPNCNSWQSKQSCPVGEIATKIKVETNGYSYTGVSMTCRAVVPQ